MKRNNSDSPNMAQLMAMSKKENDNRIKMMKGFMKLPLNMVNTKTSNSTPMVTKTKPVGNYHTNAQNFINSAKSKGMTVKNEGSELIAYPKKK